MCYKLRVDAPGEIECRRRRPFSYVRCWFRQGFREIDKYPPRKTGSSSTWAEFSLLLRDRYLCAPFYPASSLRVYSQLSRVSWYSKCVEVCVPRSARQWNTRTRRFADTVCICLSGSLEGETGKYSRNYLKWKRFKNFLSRYRWHSWKFPGTRGLRSHYRLNALYEIICDLSPPRGIRFLWGTIEALVARFLYI